MSDKINITVMINLFENIRKIELEKESSSNHYTVIYYYDLIELHIKFTADVNTSFNKEFDSVVHAYRYMSDVDVKNIVFDQYSVIYTEESKAKIKLPVSILKQLEIEMKAFLEVSEVEELV